MSDVRSILINTLVGQSVSSVRDGSFIVLDTTSNSQYETASYVGRFSICADVINSVYRLQTRKRQTSNWLSDRYAKHVVLVTP